MKKQSPFYPIIFGAIFLVIGVCVKQPFLIICMGAVPIIIGILLIISEKREKNGSEVLFAKKKKKQAIPIAEKIVCCSRCGADLTNSSKSVRKIGEKTYCKTCKAIVFDAYMPPKPQDNSKHFTCSRCGGMVAESQEVVLDNLPYCKICAQIISEKNKTEVSADSLCEADSTIPSNDLLQISYEISGITGASLRSQITSIADRLIEGGFSFCKANTETENNGDCGVPYTDYSSFKNLEQKGYSRLSAYLSRNTLKVCVAAQKGRTVLRWFDATDKTFATTRIFVEGIAEEVYANQCFVKQIGNAKFDGAFFDNWN